MTDLIDVDEKYKKGWTSGLPETPCGHGSMISNTAKQRLWIPKLVIEHKIKSIVDIGAGDLNWIKQMPLPVGVIYKPFDLVPRDASVNSFNLNTTIAPKADLIMCLWVLNHFPELKIENAFNNLLKSQSKFLLITLRDTWWKPKLDIVDMIILNNKKDIMVLAKI
ncbi:MAG: hypothetical protein ACC657_05635 [Thiohalomonadales bacterium]